MSLLVDVSKDYGSFQLKVQLEHSQGILGMLGASGSGKSMTLKLIAGILTPDKGRIVLNDQVLFDSEKRINLPPQKRRVGYLFQNYALFPNMTVEKNILCGLHREKNSTQRKKKLLEITELFQIQELLGQYPAQLSGGQQQRVALARILVSEPELLLLDEPFSALDFYLRDKLQIQILEILRKFKRDVIFVSHSRDEVYHLCNQVALIDGGQILEKGNTKEVFANPGSRIGAALTGCKNIAAAVKTGEYEVEVPEWGISLKTAKPVKENICAVGIRAHYFHPKGRENVYAVQFSQVMEEPFETTVMFRYKNQAAGAQDLWWRLSKERWAGQMPEHLGIAPQNVLLLYQ